MNVGWGTLDWVMRERRDRSLAASHAKLSGFKVGRTVGLSYATPAVFK